MYIILNDVALEGKINIWQRIYYALDTDVFSFNRESIELGSYLDNG